MKDIYQYKQEFMIYLLSTITTVIVFIIIFLLLWRFLIKKYMYNKTKYILILAIIIFIVNIFDIAPAFLDIFTNNIYIYDIEYKTTHHRGHYILSLSKNRDTEFTFTTSDGNKHTGYLINDKKFDSYQFNEGSMTIVYAGYSNCILDVIINNP